MENKLLNIVIPTYNRPEAIKKQVKRILPFLTSEVQLYVLDNHSATEVYALFSEDELSKFTIIRHPTNIGGDANIARCLEMSNQWIWTLGDDDPIKDGSIDIVLDIIKNNSDVCYINFGNVRNYMSQGLADFATYLGQKGSFGRSFFISHCLFNMGKLKNHLIHYYKLLSSQIGQVGFVMKYLEDMPEEKFIFRSEYLVDYNTVELTWNPFNLIINSSIIFDQFHHQSRLLNNNVFKELVIMYFGFLNRCEISKKDSVYYILFIIRKYGLYNAVKHSNIYMLGSILRIILPAFIYNKIKKNIRHNG